MLTVYTLAFVFSFFKHSVHNVSWGFSAVSHSIQTHWKGTSDKKPQSKTKHTHCRFPWDTIAILQSHHANTLHYKHTQNTVILPPISLERGFLTLTMQRPITCMPLSVVSSFHSEGQGEQDCKKAKSCMHTVSHTHGHTCLHLIPISFWDQRKIYISSGGAEVFSRTLSLFVIRPNPCGSPNHAVCMCPCVCRLRPWPRVRTYLGEVSRSERSGRWIRADTHLGPS